MSRTSGLFLLFALVSSHADAQQLSGTSPVALHAGVAYARLPDTDFETVRALSGQDLFSQVKARESRGDFVVFVSQRLWADGGDGARVYASVGTALRDAGSVLYLGGSVGVSRALVTAGLSTRLVEEGVGPVPDQVFRGSGDRTLFAGLQQEREWGFFAAITFGLIQ